MVVIYCDMEGEGERGEMIERIRIISTNEFERFFETEEESRQFETQKYHFCKK
jgi:hypothetical protein